MTGQSLKSIKLTLPAGGTAVKVVLPVNANHVSLITALADLQMAVNETAVAVATAAPAAGATVTASQFSAGITAGDTREGIRVPEGSYLSLRSAAGGVVTVNAYEG